ncbi:fibronectin type III domain-containing protein [Comamonas sp. MYb69]|uniref:fibronectin type III domain-containing protein n=1 Tax=Comamonas sp. MYb69 TaxID=1848650 RepID=UPI0030A48920
MKPLYRQPIWGFFLLCVLCLVPLARLWAATSSFSPQSATVASGGSIAIDISAFDGPDNFGFGEGAVAPPNQPVAPLHGIAVVGPNINGEQSVTYSHDGSATSSDTFTLEDPQGDSLVFNIIITASGSAISVSPGSLTLKTGMAASTAFTATGGMPPYSYVVVGADTLPAGLALSPDGQLSGTPSVRGNYSFSVRATDSLAVSGTKSYAGVLANPDLSISPATIHLATGMSASAQVPVAGGVTPLALSLQPGSTMPAGLTLSANGGITGTPTVPGSYTVQLLVSDASLDPIFPLVDYSEIHTLTIVVANATAPGAPVIGTAIGGNGAAQIAFTPPASDGGSAIQSYMASCGSNSQSGTASPIEVSGLINGATYMCTVTATNAIGTSAASGSVAVMPKGAPLAPSLTSAQPADSFAVLTFSEPSSDGGDPITGYAATCDGGATFHSGSPPSITVPGLSNGTAYSCTVVVSNSVGSTPSNALSVTPRAAPAAPSITSAVPLNGKASIVFTAPANNGGSAILDYRVSCSGGLTATGPDSPIEVGGMANGSAYTCTVAARNAAGFGAESAAASVTPFGPPGAPTISSATPGNAQATVTFTAPLVDGGRPVSDYTATCSAAGAPTRTQVGTSSPLVVTGLVNGTAYSCSVTASNLAGAGAPSAVVNVTPGVVPDAPTIGPATRGNGQVLVDFTPAAPNGVAVIDFTATCLPGSVSVTATTGPITVAGLTNGTAYSCSVTARNAIGSSQPSASVTATPATLPGAPSITTISSGNAELTLSFAPPASDGGSAITAYSASCGAGTTAVSGTSSPLKITGLTNGTTYNCTVTASNDVGPGPASAAQTGIPSAKSYSAASPSGTGVITATLSGGGAGCGFDTSRYLPESEMATPLAGIRFPEGLFDFKTTGCEVGSTITIELAYPSAVPAGAQYWKYGPQPGKAPSWYVYPATVGANTITYTVTDGQIGDDDLAANGSIADPGGFGVAEASASAVPVPSQSQGMLALLALLLAALAWQQAPRRSRGAAHNKQGEH